ncbi:unnamed protein product [Brassica napus]|uniref:(rape) hypothetical protein n=1 Tax=Brassica napus TaxID=3708 RepID=A0A816JY58_BRANA|nr:unnamed protein product [Brassica napus]CAF2096500.1 unnamed protein product [Brassica napus]
MESPVKLLEHPHLTGVIYLERRQAFLALTKASPGISANGSLGTGSSKLLVLSTKSLDVHRV